MPPKRNKNNNEMKILEDKQKRLLETRLIRISKVMDNYVYNNKRISEADARAYVQEVATYKLQSSNDARSLQVIHKIIHFMNAIIAELQEENCNNSVPGVETNCPSSEDALPDGDRGIFSQIPTCSTFYKETVANKDVETIDLYNDKDITEQTNVQADLDIHRPLSPVYSLPDVDREIFSQISLHLNLNGETANNNTDIETIDLCDDKDITDRNNILVDVEIHRAMSNLSISRDNEAQVESQDCSQSILEHFEPQENLQLQRRGIIKNTSNLNITQSKVPEMPLKGPNRTHITQNSKITVPKNVPENENDNVIFIEPQKNACNPVKKGRKKQGTNKGNPKKTVNRQKKNDKNKKVYLETDKTNAKTINKQNSITQNNKVTVSNKKMNASVKNTNDNNIQQTPLSNVCASNDIKKSIYNKSIAKIYNQKVDNDISWIENIRYVREISRDETDATFASLEATFWDNLELPNNWDEKDFDY